MPPGPLPGANTRRTNSPTIPTTRLPAGGRKGRPPNPPEGYNLAEAGRNWWKWAWGTPQACAWDPGAKYAVARRARLEDDLAVIGEFDPHALDWFFSSLELSDEKAVQEAMRELGRIIGDLQRLAGGKLAIEKEMRELDKRLGLDPKALAELRWVIVADEQPAAKPASHAPAAPAADEQAADVPRLRAV